MIIEFTDKGIKGLLSGDLTWDLLQQVQISIEKSIAELEKVQETIGDLFDRKEAYEEFLHNNFRVGESAALLPEY